MESRYLIDIISNISDAFGIKRAGNFPVPVGVEIVGEENDIFYLGPQLDKRLMRGDRLNIMSDIRVAIKEINDGKARKTD